MTLQKALEEAFECKPIGVTVDFSALFSANLVTAYLTQYAWDFDVDWKKEFVTVSLSDKEMKVADEWIIENETDLDAHLMSVLTEGYKITMTYHDNTDAYICSLVGNKKCSHNQGSSMSTWGSSPLDALTLALYKHLVYCDSGDWGDKKPAPRRG